MIVVKLVSILSASLLAYAAEPIVPIPQKIAYDPIKAKIGQVLFFDPILSKDKTVACVNCHNLYTGGADSDAVSSGIEGKKGRMNAPTVLNAVFNFKQFWNGRAKNLAEQASGPIHNPVEMGMSDRMVAARLNADRKYRQLFQPLKGSDRITFDDVTGTIAEYEKTLITPNSRFDRFLRKEIRLTPKEELGYADFKRLGCISCHNGVNIGGNSFQKFGVITPVTWSENSDDRYQMTRREQDKNVYKVPTLRNIVLTAPYFHDGRSKTLKDAIALMSNHNLGIPLSNEESDNILAFLHTLTGTLPAADQLQ